jgi:hypothetical protein
MREMTRIAFPGRAGERETQDAGNENCFLRFLSVKKYCFFSIMLLLIFLLDASEMLLTLKQRAEELANWTAARGELLASLAPNNTFVNKSIYN